LENEGKRYARTDVTHVHLFVEIPVWNKTNLSFEERFDRFLSKCTSAFAEYIYLPSPTTTSKRSTVTLINPDTGEITKRSIRTPKTSKALDVRALRTEHPKYVLKQTRNLDIASERIFLPKISRRSIDDAKSKKT
jgi:hypothetical protein